MATDWIYENIVLVDAVLRATANAYAVQLDPDAGGQNSFVLELSATGQAPATHLACVTSARQAEQDGLRQFLESGVVPGTLFWRRDAITKVLQLTNCQASIARFGQVITLDQAIADAGLQQIIAEVV